ncbi:MAG: hypothetical protein AAB214_11810, partial [Fibrobacterota bacterium]
GPLNQVFQRPFCFVWDDAGPVIFRDYIALLTSWWSPIGNGHACGLPLSKQLLGAASQHDHFVGSGSRSGFRTRKMQNQRNQFQGKPHTALIVP